MFIDTQRIVFDRGETTGLSVFPLLRLALGWRRKLAALAAALHETRRSEAARFIARHHELFHQAGSPSVDLLSDPDTGSSP